MEFRFETLKFGTSASGDITARFLQIYEFPIHASNLAKFGPWKIESGAVIFERTFNESAFMHLVDKGFLNLKNLITGKPTTYIHKSSGIPLFGSIEFGIIDRGSNIIEIRPISGCNIKCIYCSVSDDERDRDIVVEKDYLVEEFKKLVAFKGIRSIEAHIGTQGEPTLYADLIPLIRDLKAIPAVKMIEIVTNGVTLTKKYVDDLAAAGLTRLQLSLNAIDEEKAWEIAGIRTPFGKIKEICPYIAEKIDLLLAPTYIPGINDDQLEKLVLFAKSLKTATYTPKIFIQNYLEYQLGRNPAKQASFDKFFAMLRDLEKKHDIVLVADKDLFKVEEAKTYPAVFRKDEIVEVDVAMPGRLPGEMICVGRGVCVSVMKCPPGKKTVRIRIIRTKHNVYHGVVV